MSEEWENNHQPEQEYHSQDEHHGESEQQQEEQQEEFQQQETEQSEEEFEELADAPIETEVTARDAGFTWRDVAAVSAFVVKYLRAPFLHRNAFQDILKLYAEDPVELARELYVASGTPQDRSDAIRFVTNLLHRQKHNQLDFMAGIQIMGSMSEMDVEQVRQIVTAVNTTANIYWNPNQENVYDELRYRKNMDTQQVVMHILGTLSPDKIKLDDALEMFEWANELTNIWPGE